MLQEAQKFMKDNVDEADAIVVEYAQDAAPASTRRESQSGRLVFDVLPAAGAERDVIWDMFKVAVDTGYLPKLPGEDAIYKPQ